MFCNSQRHHKGGGRALTPVDRGRPVLTPIQRRSPIVNLAKLKENITREAVEPQGTTVDRGRPVLTSIQRRSPIGNFANLKETFLSHCRSPGTPVDHGRPELTPSQSLSPIVNLAKLKESIARETEGPRSTMVDRGLPLLTPVNLADTQRKQHTREEVNSVAWSSMRRCLHQFKGNHRVN